MQVCPGHLYTPPGPLRVSSAAGRARRLAELQRLPAGPRSAGARTQQSPSGLVSNENGTVKMACRAFRRNPLNRLKRCVCVRVWVLLFEGILLTLIHWFNGKQKETHHFSGDTLHTQNGILSKPPDVYRQIGRDQGEQFAQNQQDSRIAPFPFRAKAILTGSHEKSKPG